VLLLGPALDLGLGTAAQRFIPEYRDRGIHDLLRGFIHGSRWVAFVSAIVIAAACAGLVKLLAPWLDDYTVIPLYLACTMLPAYALSNAQDGISRSYDGVGLGLMPTYIVRQLGLTALMGAAYAAGWPIDAVTAMVLGGVAMWLPTIGQLIVLNRRLAVAIEPGPKRYATGLWVATSLPILMVEGFYLLLAYTDILVLKQFQTPDEVAVYYAAAKTLALVSFIYFSISAATAHRFSAYHVAADRAGLSNFLTQTIRWTFWPSLAATALLLVFGRPILSLFGPQFTDSYPLMFILAVGLLARAAIGPIERFLSMMGEQRVSALVYAGAFAINLGLCFVLIPPFGLAGAAIATTTALIVESIMLFVVTKRRLGFHVFVGSARRRPETPTCTARSHPGSASSGGRSPIWRRSPPNGARSPRARSSRTSSTSQPSHSPPRPRSDATPAPAWCGPRRRRGGWSDFFRRASSVTATASCCRCWSAGLTLLRHSARRWSTARLLLP
jgi:O-antigen/teichoic acid export membrane protein